MYVCMYANEHDNVVLNIQYVNLLFVYISVYNISVYVEMFIPHHMYVWLYIYLKFMYVNIFTILASVAAPAQRCCISQLLLQ